MENAIVKNVKAAIDLTSDRYKKSLKSAFPAFKNRLQERNLTFNFASYYMHSQETDDIDVWQEVPIKKKESETKESETKESDIKEDYSQHIDTVIIDKKNKSMIFIEAKCISRSHVTVRLKEMYDDLDRLYNIADLRNESFSICGELEKYYSKEGYGVYFLIIADIWTKPGSKSIRNDIVDNWNIKEFIKPYKKLKDGNEMPKYNPLYRRTYPTNDSKLYKDETESKAKGKDILEAHHIIYALYKY